MNIAVYLYSDIYHVIRLGVITWSTLFVTMLVTFSSPVSTKITYRVQPVISELSCEKATAITQPVYPFSVCTSWPVLGFQSLTVLSKGLGASSKPSCEKAAIITQPVYLPGVYISWFMLGFQSLTMLSKVPEASSESFCEKATTIT